MQFGSNDDDDYQTAYGCSQLPLNLRGHMFLAALRAVESNQFTESESTNRGFHSGCKVIILTSWVLECSVNVSHRSERQIIRFYQASHPEAQGLHDWFGHDPSLVQDS